MGHLVGGISSGGRVVPDLDGKAFLVASAQGAFVFDDAGRRYVDMAMGFGAAFLGHGDQGVNDAVCAAIHRGSMPGYAHRLEEEAAARLAAHTGDLDRVIFVNSGSEAVHLACRAARALTGRRRIAKMAAGYDGWFEDVALGAAGSPESCMRNGERPSRGDTLLLRFNDVADVARLFDETDDIAAVLLEPMLANAGCLMPEPGYLQHVAEMARRRGAVVIMDEVLTGFRMHAGLACHRDGVRPDLATVGKAIGNGFAVAAVIGRSDVMAVFEHGGVARAGTANGNPLACAAVKASMTALDRVDYGVLERSGALLRTEVERCLADNGIPVVTSGHGTVFSLWRGSAAPKNGEEALMAADAGFATRLHLALRRAGVMTMCSPYGRFYLSACHDAALVDRCALAFGQAARAMAAEKAYA